jgi:outer membrane protein assembly factor BamB
MCRRFLTGLVLCPLLVFAGCDWTHVRFGPERTGYNPGETLITPENVATLVEKWSVVLAPRVGNPVTAHANVYVNANAAFTAGLYALDAETGALRWSDVRSVDPNPFFGPSRLGIAAANRRLYAGFEPTPTRPGEPTQLEAFDAETGALEWSAGGGTDPAVVGDVVYSTFSVRAGDPFSGWLASDANTGALLFGRGSSSGESSGLAVADGVLYIGIEGELKAFDATGTNCSGGPPKICEPLWSGTVEPVGFPVVAGGVVYVPARDGKVYAFDAKGCGAVSCPPLWSTTTGGRISSTPAVANGVIYVGALDGKLYAFDADGCGQASCSPRWRASTGDRIVSSPAVANGVVFVGSVDGKLYGFSANGCFGGRCVPLWTATTGGAVVSSPAVANGMVFVGSGGKLYAYDLADQ